MGRVSDARERLLDAARDLIWQQSYGSVSIDAICEKAGVKKGSFYYFFHSKSDLAVTVLEACWANIKQELDRIFSPSLPPLERIRNYFEFLFEQQARLKEKFGHVLGCPFGCVGAEISQQDAHLCEKVREILSITPKYMESALRDAHAAGLIHVPDPTAKASALFSFLEGVLLQARIQDDLTLIQRIPQTALEMLGVPLR